MKQLVVLAVALGSISLGTLPRVASAQSSRATCRVLDGTFTSVVITDPALCDSPVGMCTAGTLVGDIEGSYDFAFLTMVPDPRDPSIVHYTARSVVTTDAGHLYGEDTGTMRLAPDGTAAFITTVSVYTGDGCFANARGRIVAPGMLNLVSGEASGTYGALICGRPGIRRCF